MSEVQSLIDRGVPLNGENFEKDDIPLNYPLDNAIKVHIYTYGSRFEFEIIEMINNFNWLVCLFVYSSHFCYRIQ